MCNHFYNLFFFFFLLWVFEIWVCVTLVADLNSDSPHAISLATTRGWPVRTAAWVQVLRVKIPPHLNVMFSLINLTDSRVVKSTVLGVDHWAPTLATPLTNSLTFGEPLACLDLFY